MTARKRKATRTSFQPGEERTREAGRKGGQVSARQRRRIKAPYTGTILDAMDAVADLRDPSWRAWRTVWRATFGMPLTGEHVPRYRRHTNRETPSTAQVDELWIVAGRRGGKSRMAALPGPSPFSALVRLGARVVVRFGRCCGRCHERPQLSPKRSAPLQ